MITLTVLGNYGPYAPPKSACSGYLLDADGFQMLWDCGNGAFAKFLKYGDLNKLQILILTHFHSDHCADVSCLRHALEQAMKTGQRTNPVFVYLPEENCEASRKIKAAEDVFVPISLAEAMTFQNDFHRFILEFFPVQHGVLAYGVRLCVGGKRILTYTGDSGWFESLGKECYDSKFLLAEMGLWEPQQAADSEATHLSPRQAGQLAQRAGTEQLLLTHFHPEADLHRLQREAEQTFDGTVLLTGCGKCYLLDETP